MLYVTTIGKIIILICFGLLICYGAKSQTGDWQHFGTSEGLLSEEVYDIQQDSKGYLWAHTELGAQRYNGQVWAMAPGFKANGSVIYATATDKKGRCWYFTSQGILGYYSENQFYPQAISDTLRKLTLRCNSLVFKMVFLDEDRLLLYTQIAGYCYHLKNKKLSVWKSGQSNRFEVKRGAHQLASITTPYFANGTEPNHPTKNKFLEVFLTTKTGLSKTITLNKKGSPTRYAYLETGKSCWFAADQYIYRIDSTGKINSIVLPSRFTFIKAVDGKIAVGTYFKGCFYYNEDGKQEARWFENESVSGICKDRWGGIWLSSLESGVWYNPHPTISPAKGISEPVSLLRAFDSMLVVGAGDNGLYSINPKSMRRLNLRSEGNCRYTDIEASPRGFYIGGSSIAYQVNARFEANSLTMATDKETGSPSLSLDIEPYSGDTVLFTSRRGVHLMVGHISQPLIREESPTTFVRCWKNYVWVTGNQGLKQYAWRGGDLILVKHWFAGLWTNAIAVRPDGLWISVYQNGLFHFSTPSEALAINGLSKIGLIHQFLFINDSSLVLATSKGVVATTYFARNQTIILNRLLSPKTIHFLELWNQYLWMGGKSGLYRMRWESTSPEKPILLFTQCTANGIAHNFEPGMQFDHSENQLSFQADFLAGGLQPHSFLYKLIGTDTLSGSTDKPHFEFQNLKSGSYKLSISAIEPTGRILPQQWTTYFAIEVPFWEEWTFRVLAMVLFLALAYWLTRSIITYYRRKDAEAGKITQLLASYRITAMQAQMNPHFVSNALTAIQNLMLDGQTDTANDYLTRFSRMLRMVLNFSEKPLISLSEELGLIRLNIALEQLRFTQQFDFIEEIDPELDLATTRLPSLITQPLVENAIWHGLIPLAGKRKGRLVYRMRKYGDQLFSIEIEDNGVGRTQTKPNDRKGLKLTRDRLQNLNQWASTKFARFEIIDLKAGSGESDGTMVRIFLPLQLHEANP